MLSGGKKSLVWTFCVACAVVITVAAVVNWRSLWQRYRWSAYSRDIGTWIRDVQESADRDANAAMAYLDREEGLENVLDWIVRRASECVELKRSQRSSRVSLPPLERAVWATVGLRGVGRGGRDSLFWHAWYGGQEFEYSADPLWTAPESLERIWFVLDRQESREVELGGLVVRISAIDEAEASQPDLMPEEAKIAYRPDARGIVLVLRSSRSGEVGSESADSAGPR